MNKLGRKKSSDPVQEALRQEKQDWNEDTSELIKNLISLKKGLNGRGDSSEGLPSSSIKDPMPPQIGAYLNEVASSASKVIEEAKNIIHHQEHYSASRKKKQALSASEEEIIKISELINEASWFGSRFLARNWWLRNLPPEHKKLVIDIMYKLVDIKDRLKVFEENLIEPNQKGLARAFDQSLGNFAIYRNGVLARISQFLGKGKLPHVNLEEAKPGAAPTPPPAPAAKPEAGDPKLTELPRARDRETGRTRVSDPEIVKLIGKDESQFRNKIKPLIDRGIIEPAQEQDLNSFQDKFDKMRTAYIAIQEAAKTKGIAVGNIQRMSADLQVKHEDAVKAFMENFYLKGKKSPEGWKFGDPTLITPIKQLNLEKDLTLDSFTFINIYQNLPLQEIQEFIEAMGEDSPSDGYEDSDGYEAANADDVSLIKDAGFFRKFIREKILNFKTPTAIEIEQKRALYASKELRQEINKVLDLLEDPSTSQDSMVIGVNNLTKEFKNLSTLMKSIGETYRLLTTSEEIPKKDVDYYDRLLKSTPDTI